MPQPLRPGELVEVKSASEILATLDENGAAASLPFMPEMVSACGRQFRVSARVVKTCASLPRLTMRRFPADDVVLLENVRCSGTDHGGCQKGCMVFWRESWLRRPGETTKPSSEPGDVAQLQTRLKTRAGDTYFCQASELLNASIPLSIEGRLMACVDDVRAGNCSAAAMTWRIAIWFFWRMRRALLEHYGRGARTTTPTRSLGLRVGEPVAVRSMADISATLNHGARNRGLFFTPAMRSLCGKSSRVATRVDKLIVDGSGEMRTLCDTVYLEGSPCACAHVAFGGCNRGEHAYWREAWLDRSATGTSDSKEHGIGWHSTN